MAPGDELTHIGQRLRCLQHCALHRRTIKLTCQLCRRERRLDAIPLWWMFERKGWSDALPQAIGRLYCQDCREAGQVGRFRYEITREPFDAEQPPYPDERDWKRVVSRYRS